MRRSSGLWAEAVFESGDRFVVLALCQETFGFRGLDAIGPDEAGKVDARLETKAWAGGYCFPLGVDGLHPYEIRVRHACEMGWEHAVLVHGDDSERDDRGLVELQAMAVGTQHHRADGAISALLRGYTVDLNFVSAGAVVGLPRNETRSQLGYFYGFHEA